MEHRLNGGRSIGLNKRQKRESEYDGRVTHPARGTFWFKAVNQPLPIPPTNIRDTHCCSSPEVQMHLEESKKSQMYKCVYVCRRERERENPDVSLPLPLSVTTRPVGCLRTVDVCTLL